MHKEDAEDAGEKGMVADLDKINEAGKHLLMLINDILDLSKIEAGRMELYNESFDLERVLTEVASMAQPLVSKKRNRFELIRPDGGIPMVGDLTRIRQILFNLISNASKFTEDGVITLRTLGRRMPHGAHGRGGHWHGLNAEQLSASAVPGLYPGRLHHPQVRRHRADW